MKFLSTLLSIVFCSLVFTSCSKYGKVFKSKDYAYKLTMADKYFTEKKYTVAQELYEELYPVYKGTDKFEEIYYKDAYCFYYLKNYRDAENFFKGFLEVFPNSPKAEEVDFMHALCFYKQSHKIELDQTNTEKSIGVMQTFICETDGAAKFVIPFLQMLYFLESYCYKFKKWQKIIYILRLQPRRFQIPNALALSRKKIKLHRIFAGK